MSDEPDPLAPRASTPPPGFSPAPSSQPAPASHAASFAQSVPAPERATGFAREASDSSSTVSLAPDAWIGALAMLAIVFGSFGPWAVAAGTSVSALGHGGKAIYTLIAGVVLLVPVIRNRWPGLAVAAGAVATVVAYRDGLDISSLTDATGGVVEVSLGWGLILCGVGGMLAIAWGLHRVLQARQAAEE